jgi:hypothetical protein
MQCDLAEKGKQHLQANSSSSSSSSSSNLRSVWYPGGRVESSAYETQISREGRTSPAGIQQQQQQQPEKLLVLRGSESSAYATRLGREGRAHKSALAAEAALS